MSRIINILFGNREIDSTFIDDTTTFILSSNEGEGPGGVFQKNFCRLIKTVKHNGENLYLIKTEQTFTGIDFGIKAVSVNKFFMAIRHPSNFKKDKENDVIIYLPIDLKNPLNGPFEEMKVIDWAIIKDIKNNPVEI